MEYELSPTSPRELGFYSHPMWWPGQRDGVEQIVKLWRDGVKVVMVNGPTGAGKSITGLGAAATWAEMHDQQLNVTVLTQTRDLQEQYSTEFQECRAATGRNNWTCGIAPNKRANQCEEIGVGSCIPYCPYRKQREEALASPIRAINYAYYGATGSMFHAPIMVADEADYLGQLLVNAKSVEITELDYELPNGILEDETREDMISELVELTEKGAQPKERELAKRAVSLLSDSGYVIKHLDGVLVPWPESKLVKQFCSQPTLVMSATVFAPQYWSKLWGIPIGWVELPCPVPAANRPIRLLNCAYINKDTTDDQWIKIIQVLDNIIADRVESKGVIHSVSNRLTEFILKHSKYNYLMFHAAGESRLTGIRNFINADKGVLIGPNLTRGLNLEGDLCRYVIFPKVPYPSLGDARVQENMKGGDERYLVETLSAVIQGAGRGIRNKEDHCEIFIMDSNMNSLLRKTRDWLPSWVREAIVYE